MVFSGDITAGYLVDGSNKPPYLTNIYGEADADTIAFGDELGIGMTDTLGSDGYVHLGSQTRVHAAGGEDLFRIVNGKVVYEVDVTAKDGTQSEVLVDATNGKILRDQQD